MERCPRVVSRQECERVVCSLFDDKTEAAAARVAMFRLPCSVYDSQEDGTIRKRHFFLLKQGSTKSKSLLPSSSVSPSLLAVITNSCPITMQITGYRAVTCVCKGQASFCFLVNVLIPAAAHVYA
jgi:hypothetical protein